MAPFQRGLQRIVKGRTTPIIPVHLDRLMGSIFSPASHRRLPERIPYPVTVSFGKPMPAGLVALRAAAGDLRAGPAGMVVPQGRSPAAPPRVHPPGAPAPVAAGPRRLPDAAGLVFQGPGRRARDRPRPAAALGGPVGRRHPACRRASAGALVNLAATLAGSAVVNLNFTAGRAGMESAAAQAGLRTVVTSRAFLEKAKLEPPERPGADLSSKTCWPASVRRIAWPRAALAVLRPGPASGAWPAAPRAADGRRHRDHHLQQRQHGRAQGRGPLPLQHRLQRPGDRARRIAPCRTTG